MKTKNERLQHQRLDQEHQETLEKMLELLVLKKWQGFANSFSQQHFSYNAIGELKYSSEEKVTFAAYFRCFGKVFRKDCASRSDEKKTWLLQRIFRQSDHKKYVNYILPKNPKDIV